MKLQQALLLPDSHIPFECLTSFRLLHKVIADLSISAVYLEGDFLDMYGLSFYEQDPSFGDLAELYDREINCGIQRIEELRELTHGCPLHYLEGNHEYRLKKYMNKFAPALRNRLSVPTELGLDSMKRVYWHPFTNTQSVQVLGANLYVRHCPPVGGTPLNVAKQAGASVIYGHTHQEGIDTFVNKLNGEKIVAHNGGCLVDFNAKVFDYVSGRPNWTKAFSIVSVYGDEFWIDVARINGNKTVFRGKLYEIKEAS